MKRVLCILGVCFFTFFSIAGGEETPGNLEKCTPVCLKSSISTRTPGRIIGDWNIIPHEFYTNWPLRDQSYEMLSQDPGSLGCLVYGMALYAKDINKNLPLEKYVRLLVGFHYPVSDIVAWANGLISGKIPLHTKGELQFISWLLEDGVIKLVNHKFKAGGSVSFIVGATWATKYSLKQNLNHERLHAFWHASTGFREKWTQKWNSLSRADKDSILQELRLYDTTNESGIIEEWAVRQNENDLLWNDLTN